MRLPLQVDVLASGFAPILLHPHRLPDGAVRGRATRGTEQFAEGQALILASGVAA